MLFAFFVISSLRSTISSPIMASNTSVSVPVHFVPSVYSKGGKEITPGAGWNVTYEPSEEHKGMPGYSGDMTAVNDEEERFQFLKAYLLIVLLPFVLLGYDYYLR
jgi:hypothetical protein